MPDIATGSLTVPMALRNWLGSKYPTLQLREAWLTSTIASFNGPRGGAEQPLAAHVEKALLHTELSKAVDRGNLPSGIAQMKDGIVGGGARGSILVQVKSKIDIGVSLQRQLDVLEARRDLCTTNAPSNGVASASSSSAAAAAATAARSTANENEGGEDHMAAYQAAEDDRSLSSTQFPRSTLQLELSDGFTTVTAFEHQSIPSLSMNSGEEGGTALGSKLLLKDIRVRSGRLLLNPKGVTLKGGMVEEWEKEAEEKLIDRLRTKLGKPPLVRRDRRRGRGRGGEGGGSSSSARAGSSNGTGRINGTASGSRTAQRQVHSDAEMRMEDEDEDEDEALREAEAAAAQSRPPRTTSVQAPSSSRRPASPTPTLQAESLSVPPTSGRLMSSSSRSAGKRRAEVPIDEDDEFADLSFGFIATPPEPAVHPALRGEANSFDDDEEDWEEDLPIRAPTSSSRRSKILQPDRQKRPSRKKLAVEGDEEYEDDDDVVILEHNDRGNPIVLSD